MTALRKSQLHQRVCAALGIEPPTERLDEVPLLIEPPGLTALAVWAFTLTDPKGGRHPSEAKIQLILPGQERGERRSFESDADRYRILIGSPRAGDLFVLWDAYKQTTFTWSKNVQVRGEILWRAEVDGLATGKRLRGQETVIACRPEHLKTAIKARINTE